MATNGQDRANQKKKNFGNFQQNRAILSPAMKQSVQSKSFHAVFTCSTDAFEAFIISKVSPSSPPTSPFPFSPLLFLTVCFFISLTALIIQNHSWPLLFFLPSLRSDVQQGFL